MSAPTAPERAEPSGVGSLTPRRADRLVCLINPWHHVGAESGYYPPPSDCLGMGYVAAVLREEGHAVEMYDAYVSRAAPEEIAGAIEDRVGGRELVLGFSFMCPTQLPHAEIIVRRLREAGIPVVHVTAGGQFAATSHRYLLTEHEEIYDSVVWGEGEETVVELFSALDAGDEWPDVPGVAARKGDGVDLEIRDGDPDLTQLPWPARDTLPELRERNGVVNMDTSRGCESSCVFCMSREILRHTATKDRWRSRTPEDVVDEMEWIVRHGGVHRFNFTDENTIGNSDHRRRLLDVADEIRSRGLDVQFNAYIRSQDVDEELLRELHDAGLASVFIGIESFWQPTLDLLNKRVDVETNLQAVRTVRRVEGLRLYFGLMTYHPWVTMEELLHNLGTLRSEILGIPLTGPELIKRLQQVMLIYRGTPSYHLARRDGLVEAEPRYDQGICDYTIPERPRRVLRFVTDVLDELKQPQHQLFLAATADENRNDEAVQARVRALNLEIDAHVLDEVETFAEAVAAGAEEDALRGMTDEARVRTRRLVAKVRDFRLPEGRGVGKVDQPDATFVAEAERVGS